MFPKPVENMAAAAGCYGHDANKPILQLSPTGAISLSHSSEAFAQGVLDVRGGVSIIEVTPGLEIDPSTERLVRAPEPVSRHLISAIQGITGITMGAVGDAAPYGLERISAACRQ